MGVGGSQVRHWRNTQPRCTRLSEYEPSRVDKGQQKEETVLTNIIFTQAVQMYGKLTGDPHSGSCIWLEVRTALWVEKRGGGRLWLASSRNVRICIFIC